jgi:hypothetical protein
VRTIEGPLASVESDPLVAAFAGHLPAPHAGIEVEGAITTAPTDSRSSPSRRPPSR